MKKTFFIALIAIIALAFSSCRTEEAVKKYSAAQTRVIYPLEDALMADIDVKGEKVVGTYSGVIDGEINMDALKSNAVYNALMDGTKGDILVAPIYEVAIEEFENDKQIKVTVSGYPAFYKNFRPAPRVGSYEFKEFNQGSPYVIITKDKDGNPVDYETVQPASSVEGVNLGTVKSVKFTNSNNSDKKK